MSRSADDGGANSGPVGNRKFSDTDGLTGLFYRVSQPDRAVVALAGKLPVVLYQCEPAEQSRSVEVMGDPDIR